MTQPLDEGFFPEPTKKSSYRRKADLIYEEKKALTCLTTSSFARITYPSHSKAEYGRYRIRRALWHAEAEGLVATSLKQEGDSYHVYLWLRDAFGCSRITPAIRQTIDDSPETHFTIGEEMIDPELTKKQLAHSLSRIGVGDEPQSFDDYLRQVEMLEAGKPQSTLERLSEAGAASDTSQALSPFSELLRLSDDVPSSEEGGDQ